MTSTTTSTKQFVVAALLATALAAPVDVAGPGYVALPVEKRKANATSSHLTRRSIPDSLTNEVLEYVATFTLGSPGQNIEALVDTGSSDLWVYSNQVSGVPYTYDSSQSSTYEYVNDDFSIGYVDGTSASGDFVTDDLTWGGATVNVQFAVVDEQVENTQLTVFGIAQEGTEAAPTEYANYPAALKNQGKISSTAYSLYLDDVEAETGTLLFGGVDAAQYTGQLYTVPITSSSSFNVDFEVYNTRSNGVLDSGTSFTYLPDAVAEKIAADYGATWNSNEGVYKRSSPYSGSSLTYSFSGAEVTVPASELFIEDPLGSSGYVLTIAPTSQTQGYVILGDSFLRSAYVVYDIDSSQIAIAQSNWNSDGSSITAITSSGIPGAQSAPGF